MHLVRFHLSKRKWASQPELQPVTIPRDAAGKGLFQRYAASGDSGIRRLAVMLVAHQQANAEDDQDQPSELPQLSQGVAIDQIQIGQRLSLARPWSVTERPLPECSVQECNAKKYFQDLDSLIRQYGLTQNG